MEWQLLTPKKAFLFSCNIYKITSPTNRVYIGQTINFTKRKYQYSNPKNCHKQRRLVASLIKYGTDNHVFEIIENCCFVDLNIRERYWQDVYDVTGAFVLNIKLTRTDVLRGEIGQLAKDKISIRNSGKGNGMYGRNNNTPLRVNQLNSVSGSNNHL